MKNCCKTENTAPHKPKQNWLKWFIYAAVILAIVFVALQQINY
ncbi:hypothetical protein [uncultured Pontibacter sp.]|nr:hypothetical protein [uncultured Pontibacter sp.]